MKAKIWPEDLSALEMTDWIARLRDRATNEMAGDRVTEPEPVPPAPSAGRSRPGAEIAVRAEDGGWATSGARDEGAGAASGHADGTGWAAGSGHNEGMGWATTGAHAEGTGWAVAGAHAEDARWAAAGARAEGTGRAVIGDELRIPIAWCELGQCISYHTDPAALGEADIRARALSAGWRFDRLGRLACLRCQQRDPWFWPTHQVALWDRRAAISTVALMAAHVPQGGSTGSAGGARAPVIPAPRPAAIPAAAPTAIPAAGNSIRGRHRKQP